MNVKPANKAKIKQLFIQNRVEIDKIRQLTEIVGESWSKGAWLLFSFPQEES